jgi:hypothetical protein
MADVRGRAHEDRLSKPANEDVEYPVHIALMLAKYSRYRCPVRDHRESRFTPQLADHIRVPSLANRSIHGSEARCGLLVKEVEEDIALDARSRTG